MLWWTRRGSNPRPPRCERGALPAELRAHVRFLERLFPLSGHPKNFGFLRCFMDHLLSQLSYEPICSIFGTSVSASCSPETHRFLRCFMDHSLSQLSYEPIYLILSSPLFLSDRIAPGGLAHTCASTGTICRRPETAILYQKNQICKEAITAFLQYFCARPQIGIDRPFALIKPPSHLGCAPSPSPHHVRLPYQAGRRDRHRRPLRKLSSINGRLSYPVRLIPWPG